MWAWLILSLLGTAVQNKERESAAERGRIERSIGREKEQEVEETQRAEVMEEAGSLDPLLRQEALDASAAKTEEQIKAVLADNETMTTGDVGVVSEKLKDTRAQSVREKANNASIMAALMSKVQAPGDVGLDENMSMQNLISESQGRSGDLRRLNRTTALLADLMGTENASRMAAGGLMQSVGGAGASSSIMSGLEAPGAAGQTTGYTASGYPYSPDPKYVKPDAFGVRGIS